MNQSWLDSYADAWCRHPEAGREGGDAALAQLLRYMSEDIRYEDVPSGAVFTGHAGIKEMGAAASMMSSDITFEIVGCVAGDGSYAFESICRGTNTGRVGPLPGNGAPFTFRGVAVGEVSESGLVTSHRDYWDLAGLLGQLGVLG